MVSTQTRKEKDVTELTGPDKKLLKIKKADRVDTTVPSPCVDVCRYAVHCIGWSTTSKEKLCIGCYRNKEELINWWAWDAPRKLQALSEIDNRKRELNV